MWVESNKKASSREEGWKNILEQLPHLISEDEPLVTMFANASALLCASLENVNWCGFYFLKGDSLYLGPFAGKPACTVLQVGKGVCGTSAREKRTVIVADVEAFPGHIYCDPDSRSEIVAPLLTSDGSVAGVLDLDSPIPNRFDGDDATRLEAVNRHLMEIAQKIMEKSGSSELFV